MNLRSPVQESYATTLLPALPPHRPPPPSRPPPQYLLLHRWCWKTGHRPRPLEERASKCQQSPESPVGDCDPTESGASSLTCWLGTQGGGPGESCACSQRPGVLTRQPQAALQAATASSTFHLGSLGNGHSPPFCLSFPQI